MTMHNLTFAHHRGPWRFGRRTITVPVQFMEIAPGEPSIPITFHTLKCFYIGAWYWIWTNEPS